MFALEDACDTSTAMAIEVASKSLSQRVGLFYTPRLYCLDNFSAFSIVFEGKQYPTVEHAYQAHKFIYIGAGSAVEAVAKVIRTAPSAHEAKKLGNHPDFVALIREDWKQVKYLIMETLIRVKWEQHEYVQRKLKESKGLLLVEDSPTDSFWGRGPNWDGQNHLGRIWMELRDEVYP